MISPEAIAGTKLLQTASYLSVLYNDNLLRLGKDKLNIKNVIYLKLS